VKKARIEPKAVQSIQRHSRIRTTLDLYTQGAFLKEMGFASKMV
jgi:hypothetical protein